MNKWLREPLTIDRLNFLVLFGMMAATILALPSLILARDERRIRAFEFAGRVKDATTADSAKG